MILELLCMVFYFSEECLTPCLRRNHGMSNVLAEQQQQLQLSTCLHKMHSRSVLIVGQPHFVSAQSTTHNKYGYVLKTQENLQHGENISHMLYVCKFWFQVFGVQRAAVLRSMPSCTYLPTSTSIYKCLSLAGKKSQWVTECHHTGFIIDNITSLEKLPRTLRHFQLVGEKLSIIQ